MKINKLAIAVILLACIGGVLFGEEITAQFILEQATKVMNPEQSYAKMSMTIMTSSGEERTFVYENYGKNYGEKVLMKYLRPKRVKNQTTLMLNNADDIWAYFPRTNRTRKLATHAKKQKVEGSDFSYEDMGSGDVFTTEFDSKILAEEENEGYDCYKIELRRREGSDSGYSRMVMWVEKQDYAIITVDYYADDVPDLKEKTLVCYDIEKIDGIPTAKKMIMYNKQDNTQTTIAIDEIDYKVELEDELFTERGMKQ